MKVLAESGSCSKAGGDWKKSTRNKASGINKKKKNKPNKKKSRPLVHAFHYFLRGMQVEFKKKFPDQEESAEFSKKCRKTWNKKMSEEEKTPFRQLARADLNAIKKKTAEKRQLELEKSKPKEPLSRIFSFCKDLQLPNWGAVAQSVTMGFLMDPSAKEVWRLWIGLEPSVRERYIMKEYQDKLQFHREMEIYNQKSKGATATAEVSDDDWEQELEDGFKVMELEPKAEEGLLKKIMEMNLNESNANH